MPSRTLGLPEGTGARSRCGSGRAVHSAPQPGRGSLPDATSPRFRSWKGGFVLYTGGIEPAKNIDRLLEAYARLPEELRAGTSSPSCAGCCADERAKLEQAVTTTWGIEGRVLLGPAT